MSRHSTLASASARRMAIAPMSIPVRSPKRPKGCSPTPTMATSISFPPRRRSWTRARSADRPKCERHDLVAVLVGAERDEHELHLHADSEALRLREARLDPHLAAELHVADAVGHEGV